MPDASTLGSLIRERRLEMGFSLGQLATKLGHTAASVRRWERGEDMPEVDLLPKIAKELDLDTGRLTALRTESPAVPPDQEPAGDTDVSNEPMEGAESDATETALEGGAGETTGGVATGQDSVDPTAEAPKAHQPSLAMPWELGADTATAAPADAVPPEATDGGQDDGAVAVRADAAADTTTTDDDPEPVATADTSADATTPEPAPTASMPVVRPADLVDAPTEAVPVVPVPAVPVPASLAAGTAAPTPTRQEPVRSAIERPAFQNPFQAFFDPDQKWLYWIRAGLLFVVSLVLLYTLIWALGELWDSLGELLDTIGSTEEVSDVQPGVDGTIDSGTGAGSDT